jgi:hypothetical protein
MMNKHKDRFDFEQEIMGAWHIIDDLRTLLDSWDTLTEDKRLNILIGMADLYDMKFDTMFNTFERLIANQQFKSPDQRLSTYEDLLNREYAEDFVDRYGSNC